MTLSPQALATLHTRGPLGSGSRLSWLIPSLQIETSHVMESYANIMESVKDKIAIALDAYICQANISRRVVDYNKGDWAYLQTMKQRLEQEGKKRPKLSFKIFRPFLIPNVINKVTMQLWVPSS